MAVISTNYKYTPWKKKKSILTYVRIAAPSIVAMATPSIDFVVEQQEVGPFLFHTGNFT